MVIYKKTIECRTFEQKHMTIVRVKSKTGERFYNATGARIKEFEKLLHDAIEGNKTRDEIDNARHKALIQRWWAEAEQDPAASY